MPPQLLQDALRNATVSSPRASRSERDEAGRLVLSGAAIYMARRAWRDSGVPQLHAEALHLRGTATGGWRDEFVKLRDSLGTGWLVPLLGARGTGKTQLAVCLIREACALGLTPRYIRAADLFADLRRAFGGGGGDERALHEAYRRPGLLVIDEAHERGHSDWEDRELVNLIDHRYGSRRDTLIIANQTREAFATALGASIISRIHECGRAIVCDWPSYRTPPASRG